VEGAGAGQVTLVGQHAGEVVETPGGIGVVGAEACLVDGEGALVERAGVLEVALVRQDAGEVAETGSRGGVVGSQVGVADRQDALVQGAGAVEVTLGARTLATKLRLQAVLGWSGPKRALWIERARSRRLRARSRSPGRAGRAQRRWSSTAQS
jgi:hypothetical protein